MTPGQEGKMAEGNSVDSARVCTRTATVLLAEDEPAVRAMILAVLDLEGYQVLPADNGESALRVVESATGQEIHLLLTDVIMPRMGGVELAEKFRQLRPEARILFTSGFTAEPVVLESKTGSSIPFIQKPFLPRDLTRKVREVLDHPLDSVAAAGV
ncbi:MAG: response regulator [SAR202 cluster bacterium]|nr:response regulator [SAR202 cluster bacterium]